MWVRPIFHQNERDSFGHHNLVAEMKLNDHESFFNFTRLTPESFNKLLSIVGPRISKQNTKFRMCINPSTRLALTLR